MIISSRDSGNARRSGNRGVAHTPRNGFCRFAAFNVYCAWSCQRNRPGFGEFKGSHYAFGGRAFTINSFVRRKGRQGYACAGAAAPCSAPLRAVQSRERIGGASMLTNIELWVILIAMLAIIPCGCIMTRPKRPPAAGE